MLLIVKNISIALKQSTANILCRSIGANDEVLAKRYYVMINKFAFACIIVLSMTIGFARKPIVGLFTSDEEVQKISEDVLLFLAI